MEGFCASIQSYRYLIRFFDENSTGRAYRQSCRQLYTDVPVTRRQ
jgi:hypothetical protein